MKTNSLISILFSILLTACSTEQINTIQQATSTPAQNQPAVENPATKAVSLSPSSPILTSTPKPPLAKDAWLQMPAVPTSISDTMREVYQQGIALGNDPTRFSIIGDCQNVSSYFLSVFDSAGDFSLGAEYAYLQPTIDYYQGSYSRESLAVKSGFNVAAVLSPLRAEPEKCSNNESPLDCELCVWRLSTVFVSMETW